MIAESEEKKGLSQGSRSLACRAPRLTVAEWAEAHHLPATLEARVYTYD